MSQAVESVLPRTDFYYKKKRIKLEFKNGILLWYDEQHAVMQKILSTRNILSVQTKLKSNEERPQRVIIHYAEHIKNNEWTTQKYKFFNSNHDIISTWISTLQTAVKSLTYRPRKLLLFIKKLSSEDKATKTFKKYVQPIFELAEIELKVIVVQRVLQIHGMLLEYDLETIDGIACVGSEDSLNEILTALIDRKCDTLRLDLNNMSVTLPKISIPIGIIQAGTFEISTAFSIHGTTDPQTAAIHIALGFSRNVDLSTVHQGNILKKIFIHDVSYSFTDAMIGHPTIGITDLFTKIFQTMKGRGIEGRLRLHCTEVYTLSLCYENCSVCPSEYDESNSEPLGWKTIQGNFFIITGANIKCVGKHNSSTAIPYAHLGDGYIKVVALYDTSGSTSAKDIVFNQGNLVHEVYRCKEFSFRANQENFPGWNCDGEYFSNPNIDVRVHPHVIKLYGRGHKNLNAAQNSDI